MPRAYQIPFELRHLLYFAEVARTLHFHRAAAALAVAQPALSRQVRQLEAALGTPLLRRTSRRVELTAAGALVRDRAAALLRAAAALPPEVAALAAGRSGVLRLQFTGLAMATVLPGLLRAFARARPEVRVELAEAPTARQLAALRAGEIDGGFLHPGPEAAPAPGLEAVELLRERNGVVLPSDHPQAGRRRLRLADLGDEPWVLFPRDLNPSFHDRTLAAFAAAGVTPRIAEEVWPRGNLLGLVRAGLGIGLATPSEAAGLPADVVFRPLAGPAPESRLVLAWPAAPPPAPAFAAFAEMVRLSARRGPPPTRAPSPPATAAGPAGRAARPAGRDRPRSRAGR